MGRYTICSEAEIIKKIIGYRLGEVSSVHLEAKEHDALQRVNTNSQPTHQDIFIRA